MGLRKGGTSPRWATHSAGSAVHPIKRDGPAHVPAGTSGQRSRANALCQVALGSYARGPVEELAGPQHGVHHDCKLPAHRNGGSLKADLLAQPQAPCPKGALGRVPRQYDGRGLIEQPAQVGVAAARDMTIVVDLARLKAPCRQPKPGAHRS